MINRKHKVWYLKVALTENISLRHYFVFEDRPTYENKWFIKNHETSEWGEVSEMAARMIAETHNLDLEKDAIEVIGNSISNRKYRKVVLDEIYETPTIIEIKQENERRNGDKVESSVFVNVERIDCSDMDVSNDEADDETDNVKQGFENLAEFVEFIEKYFGEKE